MGRRCLRASAAVWPGSWCECSCRGPAAADTPGGWTGKAPGGTRCPSRPCHLSRSGRCRTAWQTLGGRRPRRWFRYGCFLFVCFLVYQERLTHCLTHLFYPVELQGQQWQHHLEVKKTWTKRVLLTHTNRKCGAKSQRNRPTHWFYRVNSVHKVSFPHVDPDLEQQDPLHIKVSL